MTKVERVKAVMSNEIPDKIPAGFWFHYPGSLSPKEMAEIHLKLYRETDMDVIKVMQDYRYVSNSKVVEPDDWYKIEFPGTECESFNKLKEVVELIKKDVGNEVLVFQTMFSPFKAASMIFGDDILMEHCKTAPEAVAAGIKIIADKLELWAKGFLDAGADGIYFSGQFAEVGRFTYDEWAMLVMPYDVQILKVAENATDKYNMLHICGEPDFDFKSHIDRYGVYPSDIVNWSVKDNHYELERGRDYFKKPVLGGMNNKGNILNGSDESIRAEVKSIIDSFGTKGLMLGADCTIQGENISIEKIAVAVKAAHDYPIK